MAVAFVSALMLVMMATPAFAFHHVFIPAAACGESPNAGGVAEVSGVDEHNPVFGVPPPLPPFGTEAVEHSERITGTPTAPCPAPNK